VPFPPMRLSTELRVSRLCWCFAFSHVAAAAPS
jgi:hypothetical protein